MSFTWLADHPLRTREQVAREIHAVALQRGLDELATVIACMTVAVEVGADDDDGNRQWWCPANQSDPDTLQLPHDSESDDADSSGYFQQRPPWWGTPAQRMTLAQSADLFLSRLSGDYHTAAGNPALAGQFAQRVQGSAYPDRYAQHWDEAWDVVRRALATTPPEGDNVGYTGDPVWLEDVLRAALGDRLVVEAGWKDRGTGGQMGDIWGVMIHHTGNDRETVAGIRDGRSDLAGPLSQCLITPDGKCHLIAVGPCNHAGIGKYPGIAANTGNQRLIGFECAWPTIQPDGSFDKGQRWPDAQIITMRDATAAVLTKLGYGADRVIGHKEYATAAPNVKWDPGNIDMGWFRGEVAKDIAGYQFPGETPVVQPPDPSPTAIPADFDKQTFQQINGRWEMLGWQTLIEAVAEIRDHLTGSTDAGKTGFKLGVKP